MIEIVITFILIALIYIYRRKIVYFIILTLKKSIEIWLSFEFFKKQNSITFINTNKQYIESELITKNNKLFSYYYIHNYKVINNNKLHYINLIKTCRMSHENLDSETQLIKTNITQLLRYQDTILLCQIIDTHDNEIYDLTNYIKTFLIDMNNIYPLQLLIHNLKSQYQINPLSDKLFIVKSDLSELIFNISNLNNCYIQDLLN